MMVTLGRAAAFLLLSAALATSVITPRTANAYTEPRITRSMANLKGMADKLGAARVEGTEAVGGKSAPVLYLGSTKINHNFDLVDAVSKEGGKGMTATVFVRSDDQFIRVSTSVPTPDGKGRAVGTVLDPAGKVIGNIRQGKAYYGEAKILGVPYVTGYEPMLDATGKVIGIYYVGHRK
jgi:hypothetical protein